MIMLKIPDSKVIEEAYLILKDEKNCEPASDNILEEANRLLASRIFTVESPPKNHRFFFLLSGIFCSSCFWIALYFLFFH
jgi:hypothetical protein